MLITDSRYTHNVNKEVYMTYLSIHSTGEGAVGVCVCIRSGSVVFQGELAKDFIFRGKSAVERSKVPFSEFDEFEVGEIEIEYIKSLCEHTCEYDI